MRFEKSLKNIDSFIISSDKTEMPPFDMTTIKLIIRINSAANIIPLTRPSNPPRSLLILPTKEILNIPFISLESIFIRKNRIANIAAEITPESALTTTGLTVLSAI